MQSWTLETFLFCPLARCEALSVDNTGGTLEEEGASLPGPAVHSLVCSWKQLQLLRHTVVLTPKEFQQHPMGGFLGSSAGISASLRVGLTGVFPWSWVAILSLYQPSELLCHPVGPGTQRLRRDLDLITAVGRVEREGCSLLGCSVSALEILAIPYISSSIFFSVCCTPS